MKFKLFSNLLALALLFLSVAGTAQGYNIGHTSATFTDAGRNNRQIEVEIYYPSDSTGENVPLPASGNDAFPPIVFGHGFVMGWNAYRNIWEGLVPNGFIVAFPKTEGGILPSHLEFGKDMAFVMLQLANLGSSSSSIFHGRVSALGAVMGHSMGGGAAFLAAQLNDSINCLLALAPAETNPSAISAAGQLAIPALILSGGNDCVTPPQAHQVPMYEALQSPCKTFISIDGGSHCQMADFNFLCQLGEASCSPSAAISRAAQHQVINDYIVPWLQSQLKADCVAGQTFNDLIAADDRISFDRTCEQCELLSAANFRMGDFEIFPNPFAENITVRTDDAEPKTLRIYDSLSRLVHEQNLSGTVQIDTRKLVSGLFLYTITHQDRLCARGKLVKN